MVLLACVASLTLTCSVMPVPAMAASSASIARSIAAKRKQAAAAAKTLATSQQELTDALTKADDVENQLEAAREDLTVTSDTLAQLETQITTGQDVLNDRAVALYKSGGMDVIQALLSVQSLDDLMTRVDLLSYIQQSDDDLLKSLTTARDQASFLQGQQTQRENDLIAPPRRSPSSRRPRRRRSGQASLCLRERCLSLSSFCRDGRGVVHRRTIVGADDDDHIGQVLRGGLHEHRPDSEGVAYRLGVGLRAVI